MEKKKEQRSKIIFSVYTGLVVFCLVCSVIICEALERNGNIIWTGGKTASVLLISLAIALTVSLVLMFVLKNRPQKETDDKEKEIPLLWQWLIWPIMALLCIPGILAYYPGNCCFDFQPQMYQIYNSAYNTHHPLAHTLLIKFFWNLGQALGGNNEIGLCFYCIFQVIVMSYVFSFAVRSMYRLTGSRKLFVITSVLYAIYPINLYLNISITKDIIFAAGMLLCVTSMLMLMYGEVKKGLNMYDVHLFAGGLILMLFRSNGPYCWVVILGLALIMLIFRRKEWKTYFKILVNILLTLVIGFVTLKLLYRGLDAQKVDKREMFSLPAQQIARVVNLYHDDIDADTLAYAETVIWPRSLYRYRPDTARPVKDDVISWEILNHTSMVADLYLKLFKQYPGEYVNAFFALYSGFLNPFDNTFLYINDEGEGVPTGLHAIQTVFYTEDMQDFNIVQRPVSEGLHSVYEKLANSDVLFTTPVISIIFSPGIYFWICLLYLGILAYGKKWDGILPVFVLLVYFASMFLGPVVHIRYVYPVMVCVPVLFAAGRYKEKER